MAIFRRFSSPLVQVASFTPLLQIFKCVCQLETYSSLLRRVVTISTNFSSWSKSPPELVGTIFHRFSGPSVRVTFQTFTPNFRIRVPTRNLFQLIREGFYYIHINYKFLNACANSKPLSAYEKVFLLHL